MKRTILNFADFEKQAAAILAASKASRADLRMEATDNDEDDSDDDSDDADDDDADDDSKGDADDDDQDDEDKDKDKDEDAVSRAEYDRVKRHRAAADRRAAELKTENTRLTQEVAALKAEGKDGKPDEAMTGRIDSLTKDVQSRDQQIKDLRIQAAFLASNKFEWADPSDALRLADLADVEIDDEDGTVHGMEDALKKLAKSKPHLLKTTRAKNGPSGTSNNGQRKGKDKTKPDREALAKTYPVLRGRR